MSLNINTLNVVIFQNSYSFTDPKTSYVET